MIIKCYNENHPYLIFIDLEFNNNELVQFAGLLFKKIENETYQLMRSYNQYITTRVCIPFMEYTNITNDFLAENGVPLKDLCITIFEDFLKGIDMKEVEVISHGLKNDRLVLQRNGINFSNYVSSVTGKTHPVDGYCTFTNAKRILKREKHLTAADIADEAGYYLFHAHNAFNDVWAEVSIFTYLKKIEQQNKEEEQKE